MRNSVRLIKILKLVFLIGIIFGLSGCNTSTWKTEVGQDLGDRKCKNTTFDTSLLYVAPWQEKFKVKPKTLRQCAFGARQSDQVSWRNGSFLSYTISYGDYFEISGDYLVRYLKRRLELDITNFDLKEVQGRHNSLWYYNHKLNRSSCYYFLTYDETFDASGTHGISKGYILGRYCSVSKENSKNAVKMIRSVGRTKL